MSPNDTSQNPFIAALNTTSTTDSSASATPANSSKALTEMLRQHPAYKRQMAMHQARAAAELAAAAPPPAPAPTGPPTPTLEDLRACLLTTEQLETLVIPPRDFLLDRWLCAGDLGYVFAPRGVGKTWMAMALPLAISMGRPLGRWKAGHEAQLATPETCATPRKPVRVLYVDGEMPLPLTQKRSRALRLARGNIALLHHESLFAHMGSSLNLALQPHRDTVTSLVVEQGFDCLILDNLSSLTSGIDENAGIDFDPLSQWLLELRRRKITVIVIHHAGRNGNMRGHSKREDACSWILELRDAKTDDDSGAKFVSHFAKPSRNTGDTLPDLLWHFTTQEDGSMNVGCEHANSSEFGAFVQHVKDGIQNQTDIAEMMGKPKGTICKWATKALKQGLISGSSRKLLPPKEEPVSAPVPTRVYKDNDDGPAPFFNNETIEAELQAANAEALRLRSQD